MKRLIVYLFSETTRLIAFMMGGLWGAGIGLLTWHSVGYWPLVFAVSALCVAIPFTFFSVGMIVTYPKH